MILKLEKTYNKTPLVPPKHVNKPVHKLFRVLVGEIRSILEYLVRSRRDAQVGEERPRCLGLHPLGCGLPAAARLPGA